MRIGVFRKHNQNEFLVKKALLVPVYANHKIDLTSRQQHARHNRKTDPKYDGVIIGSRPHEDRQKTG